MWLLDGDPSTGALIVYNNQLWSIGGTSVGAPFWAGLCALINQNRVNAGGSSLGLLGPRIYPWSVPPILAIF